MQKAKKIWSTLCICTRIIAARHFGQYKHNIWDGERDYAVYEWRGQDVWIPTGR